MKIVNPINQLIRSKYKIVKFSRFDQTEVQKCIYGTITTFTIDLGSSVNIISERMYNILYRNFEFPTNLTRYTYAYHLTEELKVDDVFMVDLRYKIPSLLSYDIVLFI